MHFYSRILLLSVAAAALTCSPVQADFIPLAQPGASYLGNTVLADFIDPDFTLVAAVEKSGVLLGYNNSLEELTVGAPNEWSTWGKPPAVESSTPRVGWTDGASSLAIGFSKPLSTFGLEIEPGNQVAEETTMTFLSGTRVVGTITLDPNGQGGALLFAASTHTNPFTSVFITNDESDDFAIAEQRFAVAPAPEPADWGLISLGLAGALWFARRRRPGLLI